MVLPQSTKEENCYKPTHYQLRLLQMVSSSALSSAVSSSTDFDSSCVSLDNRLQRAVTPTKQPDHPLINDDERPQTSNSNYWKAKALGKWRRSSFSSPKKSRDVRHLNVPSSRGSANEISDKENVSPKKDPRPGPVAYEGKNVYWEEQSVYYDAEEDNAKFEPGIVEKIKLRKNIAYQNKLNKLSANSPVQLLYQSWKETRGYSNSVSVFWNHMKFYFKTQLDKDDYVSFNPNQYTISEEYEDLSSFESFGKAISLDMKEITPDWRKFLPSPPSSSGSKETRPAGAEKVSFGPRRKFEIQEFDSEAPATACSRGGSEKPNTPISKGSLKPSSRHSLEDEKYCYRQTTEAVAYPHDCIKGLVYKLYNIVGYDTELADVNDLAFNLEVLAACIASNNKKIMKRMVDKNKETAFLRNSIRDLCHQINELQVTVEELDCKVYQLSEKLTKEKKTYTRKVKSLQEELAYFKHFTESSFTSIIEKQSELIADMNRFFKESNYASWDADTQAVLRSFATAIDTRIGEFGVFHEMNKELIIENERLRKELNGYKDSPHLERECQRLIAAMEEKNESIEQLNKVKESYSELLGKKAAMQKEIEVLREHAEDLERKMSSLEEAHKNELKEVTKMSVNQQCKTLGFFDEQLHQDELHSLEVQVLEAQDKLLMSAEEIAELHEKIASIEEDKNAIEDEKKELVESMMTAKTEYQQREMEQVAMSEKLALESELKSQILNKCLQIINRYQFELQTYTCEKKRDKFRTAIHYFTRRQRDLKDISEWIENEVLKQLNSSISSPIFENEDESPASSPNTDYCTQSSSIYSTMHDNQTTATITNQCASIPALLTNLNLQQHKDIKISNNDLQTPPEGKIQEPEEAGEVSEEGSMLTVEVSSGFVETTENFDMAADNGQETEATTQPPSTFRYGIDGAGARKVSQLMKRRNSSGQSNKFNPTSSPLLKLSENSDKRAFTDGTNTEKNAPTRFIELISSDDETF
ncbi:HGL049Cp [Eremothecium sinecaudum]|uniref:HGL049Cp n=1 Tax=Eremothecium sinecaudum TaxID=45286 RepID=A0A109UY53_9SACH|nr:HGL049Cp [Eremothecium sinecaudum]AMD22291.1 HGL049Cp [Eremothecium sinecaudum]